MPRIPTPERIWNRLLRTRSIGPTLLSLTDRFDWYCFQTQPVYTNGRRALKEMKTDEELFSFAKETFASTQKSSEFLAFLNQAKSKNPSIAMEIGVADGGTHFVIREAIQSITKMIGVEISLKRSVEHKLNHFARVGQQDILIKGSSYDPVTVSKVQKVLNGMTIDLLFIDGDHTYEGVRRDFECYRGLLSKGALVAFHDIVPDHRGRQGVNTFHWSGGVPIFWNEIKTEFRRWEFIESMDQDAFGIGVIEVE